MSDYFTIIKRPVVTEKSSHLREEENQYVFEVSTGANKVEIRKAIENLFGGRVAEVRTSIVRGKMRRMRRGYGKTPNWKKAVVSLQGDDVIELFEGV
jgi:large subunit ribosomal protein L23